MNEKQKKELLRDIVAVKLQLSTRYDYDEKMLTKWKNMLNADCWYISVKRNQLHVTFKVRYKED